MLAERHVSLCVIVNLNNIVEFSKLAKMHMSNTIIIVGTGYDRQGTNTYTILLNS